MERDCHKLEGGEDEGSSCVHVYVQGGVGWWRERNGKDDVNDNGGGEQRENEGETEKG